MRRVWVVLLVAVVGCGSALSPGSRLEFNGGELYYTSNVSRQDAERLGSYLVKEGIFTGDRKTVQLNRSGSTYEVRVVVKKGLDSDPEYVRAAKNTAADISRKVFDGAQVDVHLCDENLTTLRVAPAPPR